MKKKIIAIALALCMVTSLLPATVLAASEGEPQCTVTEGCTLSNGHEGECVLPEEGGEPDAPAACTKTEGCTLAEGHEGVCVLPEEGGEPDAPAACTKTEGCTLAEGHEGACVLPEEGGEPDAPAACTKTEGCTLAEGHEGECVLPKENGEPVVTMLDGVNTPEELETALAAGGTVVLSGNITIDNASKSFTIQNAVTLDLNGFSITRSGDSSSKLFAIKNNGSLTLNDSKGTGTVNSTYPVQLYSNATFIMNGGTITSSHGAALDIYTSAVNVKVEINGGSVTVAQGNSDNVFGIRGKENVKVDIKGGDILGAGSNRLAMYVSGDKDGAIELNINGGSVQHTGQAIQAYSGAVINVSGDAVIRSETNTAISTQSGYGVVELNMTGGTISTGSSTGYAVYAREKSRVNIGGGNVTGGTAVMVYDSANVTVTGGTLEGKKAAIGKGSSATPVISVTGGKFSSDVKEFVPEGNTTDTDSEGNFIVVVDKAKAVAEANGVGYTTVQAAIDAVANSDAAGTVKLLQSKAESVAVPAGANVTLDIPAGVTLTNTNGAHTITNSGTLAITGEGTVDNVTHAKGALVNLSGAQAVIRGGMLTRSSEASTSASQSGGNSWYVIDNHGTLEIAGGKVVNEGHFSSLIRNVGDSAAAKAVLTISGGEVEQMGFIAVKNDDNSILNVTGGVIRSNEQAVQNWTQANISGGRLEGNVITWAYGDQPSETNIAGSAVVDGDVAAVNYMDAAAQPVVNITGGTVTGSIYKGEHKGSGGIIHALYLYPEFLSEGDDEARQKEVLEEFRLGCEVGRAIGSHYFIIVPPLQRDPAGGPYTGSWEDTFSNCVRILKELSRRAEPYDMNLCFELVGFERSSVRSIGQADAVVRAVDRPNVGFVFDSYNIFLNGGCNDFSAIGSVQPEKIFAVHLMSADDVPEAQRGQDKRCFCGRGVVDTGAFLQELKAAGYSGIVSVETFRPEYWAKTPEWVIPNAYKTTRAALAENGCL